MIQISSIYRITLLSSSCHLHYFTWFIKPFSVLFYLKSLTCQFFHIFWWIGYLHISPIAPNGIRLMLYTSYQSLLFYIYLSFIFVLIININSFRCHVKMRGHEFDSLFYYCSNIQKFEHVHEFKNVLGRSEVCGGLGRM